MTDTEELSTFPYSNFYPYRIYHLSYHVVYPPPSDDDPLKQLINSPLLAHVLGHISDIRESKDKKSKICLSNFLQYLKEKIPQKECVCFNIFSCGDHRDHSTHRKRRRQKRRQRSSLLFGID